MTYRFPIHVGDRVAIAPHHDLWMAGCRFGTVTSIGGEGTLGGRFYFLDLDTGRNVTLAEEDLLGAVGPYNQPDASPSIRTGAVERGECTEYIIGRPETACRQPLDHEGPHDFDVQHEMTLCRHEDCGYGECSWLWGGGDGLCDTHRNNKGRCQRDATPRVHVDEWRLVHAVGRPCGLPEGEELTDPEESDDVTCGPCQEYL